MKRKVSHTKGPWRAHLNVPAAATPGHIIKAGAVGTPVASLPKGGRASGKQRQIANALLIAAAPDLLFSARLAVTFGGLNLATRAALELAIMKAERGAA